MKGVRRMQGARGGAQDGGSGPGPTPPEVQVRATANPSPRATGIIKAETRGEAAGRRGVVQSPLPPNGENSNRTQNGRARGWQAEGE